MFSAGLPENFRWLIYQVFIGIFYGPSTTNSEMNKSLCLPQRACNLTGKTGPEQLVHWRVNKLRRWETGQAGGNSRRHTNAWHLGDIGELMCEGPRGQRMRQEGRRQIAGGLRHVAANFLLSEKKCLIILSTNGDMIIHEWALEKYLQWRV